MRALGEKVVNQIILYEIDRVARSLADSAMLLERLDVAELSLLTVTQSPFHNDVASGGMQGRLSPRFQSRIALCAACDVQ